MKVSVLLVTYNHSKYIEQCIRSIMMQQLQWEWEIVISDDLSTDDTGTIIAKHFSSSPVPFRVLSSSRNLGFVKNYQRGFASCTGEYIAVMEGDDYWTDPKRVEKHINFLDNHPECVMTMNRYTSLIEPGSQFRLPGWHGDSEARFISTKDLAGGNQLGNLSACVFRKKALDKLKPDLFDLRIADWMIGMALGEHGVIALLKEAMSVYRVHDKGLWSGRSAEEQKMLILEHIDCYNKYLNFRYDREFQQYKAQFQSPGNRPKPALSRWLRLWTSKG